MTTAHSPLRKLKAQADQVAEQLKKAERGEPVNAGPFASKILQARDRPSIKFAVVMDDKVLALEMEWKTIAGTSQASLSEWILKQMRGARETEH